MVTYVVKRLVNALLTLLVVSFVVFSLLHFAGDPAISIAGNQASAEEIARVRSYYGFDRPIYLQYGEWLTHAVRGDFGISYHYRKPVSQMIAQRAPITIILAVCAIILAFALSMPLALWGAQRPGGIVDRAAMTLAIFAQAVPPFWLALLMISFFGVTLRFLPISGNAAPSNFVMPSVVIAIMMLPPILRLTLDGMKEALRSDYVRTARAKGIGTMRILFRHAFRNVLVAIVSISAVQFGAMLGGSIVVEQIFAMQGIGWLGYDATLRSDLPVVQAITLVVSASYVLLVLIADIANSVLDPRIRVH